MQNAESTTSFTKRNIKTQVAMVVEMMVMMMMVMMVMTQVAIVMEMIMDAFITFISGPKTAFWPQRNQNCSYGDQLVKAHGVLF